MRRQDRDLCPVCDQAIGEVDADEAHAADHAHATLAERAHQIFTATQRPWRCTSDWNRSSDSIANRPLTSCVIHLSSPYMPRPTSRSCSAPVIASGSIATAADATRRWAVRVTD